MSATEEEISRQPDSWLRAAEIAGDVRGVLPRRGERVAVIGCGTSWFVAQAYARLREDAGHGWTDAFAASELPDREYDRVVMITRSGTTSEVLELAGRLRGRMPVVSVTARSDTPIAQVSDELVELPFADERSVVQTIFATTALTLLRASLGTDIAPLASAADAALREELPAAVVEAEQWTFLGRGWTNGLATEAGLKMREACLAWTESYPAMEYRHGPISIAQPGRAVWLLGSVPDGLARDVEAAGAHFQHWAEDAQIGLVRVHLLALAVARRRGLDPDKPRNLTRSVILT